MFSSRLPVALLDIEQSNERAILNTARNRGEPEFSIFYVLNPV
jgi:hypothetical protein